jgi:N-acyl homoserine lactone hydrolase
VQPVRPAVGEYHLVFVRPQEAGKSTAQPGRHRGEQLGRGELVRSSRIRLVSSVHSDVDGLEQAAGSPQRSRDPITPRPAAAASWHGQDVFGAGRECAFGTAPALVQHGLARGVLVGPGVSIAVTISPDEQGIEHGPQFATGGGQLVDVPPGAVGVRPVLEHSGFDEARQPLREHTSRHVQMGLEVVETAHAIERVSDDQQRPAFTQHAQGAGECAVLCFVILAQHPPSVPANGSMIELSLATLASELMVRSLNSDPHLYVLDTGVIESADFAMWSPNARPGEHREMSVRSYLISHPRGTVLWDTGIDDAIAELAAGSRIADAIVFRVPRTLRSQLEEIGVRPDDVDYLGLSHLHVDHVGNIGLFPAARVLMQRAEYDAGYGPDPERFTLLPDTYTALDRNRITIVDGDHDLFGDGAVVLTPLPGHTPGHQGLLVRLRDTGPILLAADIAYTAQDYAEGAVRAGNVDLDQSRRSIERAKRIASERGATVWLHHDPDAQRAVRTAPEHYA